MPEVRQNELEETRNLREPPHFNRDIKRYVNRRGDLLLRVTDENREDFEEECNLEVENGQRVRFKDGEDVPPALVTPEVWTAYADTLEGRDSENEVISPITFDQ